MKPSAPCSARDECSEGRNYLICFYLLPSPHTLPAPSHATLQPSPSEHIFNPSWPHFGPCLHQDHQEGTGATPASFLNLLTQPFHRTRSASPPPWILVTSCLLHAHPQAAEEIYSCANWHHDRFRAAHPLGAWASQQPFLAPFSALPHSLPRLPVSDFDLYRAHLYPLSLSL